jgi:hypothetical protein
LDARAHHRRRRAATLEATINTIFTPELPARIICQYSRWRLRSGALHAGLVTHPQAVVGNGLYANPFYGGPGILSRNSAYDPGAVSDDSVRDMLEQLLAS